MMVAAMSPSRIAPRNLVSAPFFVAVGFASDDLMLEGLGANPLRLVPLVMLIGSLLAYGLITSPSPVLCVERDQNTLFAAEITAGWSRPAPLGRNCCACQRIGCTGRAMKDSKKGAVAGRGLVPQRRRRGTSAPIPQPPCSRRGRSRFTTSLPSRMPSAAGPFTSTQGVCSPTEQQAWSAMPLSWSPRRIRAA